MFVDASASLVVLMRGISTTGTSAGTSAIVLVLVLVLVLVGAPSAAPGWHGTPAPAGRLGLRPALGRWPARPAAAAPGARSTSSTRGATSPCNPSRPSGTTGSTGSIGSTSRTSISSGTSSSRTFFDEQLRGESFRGHSKPFWTSQGLLSLLLDPPGPQKPSRNLVDTSKAVSKVLRNSRV